MRKMFFLQAVCLVAHFLNAQIAETVVLKPGDDLFEKYNHEIYAYPQFIPGKVYYLSGDSAGGKMNYNNLAGKFQFVDNNGDTLDFAGETNIKYIAIAGDIYYYEKPNFLKQVAAFSVGKLAIKNSLRFADAKKIGAFGVPNSTSRIESLNEFRAYQNHKLISNEEIIFNKEKVFFIGNADNVFLPANRKNILKLYPSIKKNVDAYLDSHSINFQSENDLLDLLKFIEKAR